MILAQHLLQAAAQNVGRPAMVYQNKPVTYNELRESIGRLSYLYQQEIGHQKRVAILAHNHPALVKTFFAITNTKSLVIPLDPNATDEDLAKWIKETQATHLAVTNGFSTRARDLMREARIMLPLIEFERKQGGEYDTSYTPPSDKEPNENDVVIIFKTGGYDGAAKYVQVTHKQLHHAAISLRRPYHALPADRFMTPMNWWHPFAFTHGMLFPLMIGATCVVEQGLEGNDYLNFLVETKTTRLIDHPKSLHKMLLLMRSEQRTLPALMKSVTVGVGSLTKSLRKTFEVLKVHAAQCYGMAEATWSIAMEDTQEAHTEDRGEGMALAGLKYKVLDNNGDEITTKGEKTGQLAVSGPSIMKGFYHTSEEEAKMSTKEALRGTWLYTGDICTIKGEHEERKISFHGRKEDLIEINGEWIAPDNIDHALKKMNGITDGAAFVTKNSSGKPVLACAFVKAQKTKVSERSILEKIAESVPGAFCPTVAFVTDAIPRDFAGNVIRHQLAAQYIA